MNSCYTLHHPSYFFLAAGPPCSSEGRQRPAEAGTEALRVSTGVCCRQVAPLPTLRLLTSQVGAPASATSGEVFRGTHQTKGQDEISSNPCAASTVYIYIGFQANFKLNKINGGSRGGSGVCPPPPPLLHN